MASITISPVKGDGAEVQRADGGGVHVDGVPEVAHRRPEYPPAGVITSVIQCNTRSPRRNEGKL